MLHRQVNIEVQIQNVELYVCQIVASVMDEEPETALLKPLPF